jgi:membrane peptidoglycan carboxypeptidase
MQPFVVASIHNQKNDLVYEQKPQIIRQVISAHTAQLLTDAFEKVVDEGTAKEVKLDGVRIAGKTGTSKKIVDGKYAPGDFTASFVGFYPVEDPEIVCLVMMDNPRARSYYGGETSGPIFHAIAERIVHSSWKFSHPLMTHEPDVQDSTISVPDVRTINVTIAQKILEGHGLAVKTFGKGDVVFRQSPDPGKIVQRGDGVTLVLNSESVPQKDGTIIVPNLKGLSLRRAINLLVVDDFDVHIQGSGIVVHQDPSAGQRVRTGSTLQIECEPRSITTAALH